MAKAYCRFCGMRDEIANLVEVCGCHKKSDNSLCHRKCLESYISRNKQSEDDPVSSAATRCPTCNEPFSVKLKWRWTTDRYFSGVSLGQYFNFTIIILSSLGFFFSVINVLNSGELKTNGIRILMWFLVALMAVMTVVVFRKIYDRWERHQKEVELVDTV